MKQEVTKLLQTILRIDSQNPPGNEKKIILFIRDYLKRIGVESRIYEFQKGRPNLICMLHGRRPWKRLLLTPHVDTVPATGEWRFPPLSGTIYKNRLYGRGATDCKVNVAACLYLIKKMRKEATVLNNMDIVFAFCSDEETGSYYGIRPLLPKLQGIDYGVVLDADEFDIIIAQKGLLHVQIELFGKEAHGAYPERGINAVEKGACIVNDILKHRFTYKAHSLLEKPTVNIGKFIGGEKVNIVAGTALIEVDIRYLPSMTEKSILRKIEQIVKQYKIEYSIKVLSSQQPIEVNKKDVFIQTLVNVLKRKGVPSHIKASFGATVMTFLKEQGIKTFAFGFGTHGCAHTKDEYVELDNLYKGVVVLEEYVRALDEKCVCGGEWVSCVWGKTKKYETNHRVHRVKDNFSQCTLENFFKKQP